MPLNPSGWSQLSTGKKVLLVIGVLLMMGLIKMGVREVGLLRIPNFFLSPLEVIEQRSDCKGSGWLFDFPLVAGNLTYDGAIVGRFKEVREGLYELSLVSTGRTVLVNSYAEDGKVLLDSPVKSLGWIACKR
jgi:2-keto-4-pentenoate hydratase